MKMYPDNMADLVLVSIAIFVVLWLSCYFACRSSARIQNKPKAKWWIAILLIAFCVFAFYDTDYFHYQWNYLNIQRGHEERSNFEDIYVFISQNVSDYLLFRCIVWGTAIFCLFKIFKILKLDFNKAILIFVSIGLLKFAYARVSLAMAIIFLGLALYTTRRNSLIKPVKLVLCLAVIACAFYFHKSAAFGIGVALLSLIPLTKTRLTVMVLLFPIFVLIVEYGLYDYVMSLDKQTETFSVGTAQHYLATEFKGYSPGRLIRILLERTPFYITIYLISKSIYKNDYTHLSFPIKVVFNSTFLTVYFASIFLFINDIEVTIIYFRFLYFSFIPMCISLLILLHMNRFKKLAKITLAIGLMGTCYSLLFCYYAAYINS